MLPPEDDKTLPHPGGDPAPFALRHGVLLSRGRLWSDARALAEGLPDRPYLLNLCEDRYLFCVTLLAALCRGQICLLPPSGRAGVLREVLGEFPDCYQAGEREPAEPVCPWFAIAQPKPAGSAAAVDFPADQTALIAFTSGSTGRPKACRHRLGTFRVSARQALASLNLEKARLLLVSTTPQQHMYGLETSIFWPLFSSLVLHAGRPFFPEDIRATLRGAPLPCLLATTPTHLSALARSGGEWPNLEGILCSTASLAEDLARQAEAATGAVVREILGSTETLSFATRRTTGETLWRPYREAGLRPEGREAAWLSSPHLESPVLLEDRFRIEPDGRFQLLGRSGDMIKIGGKRGSLADLNRRLATIEGVDDGLFYTYRNSRGECRTGAVVVSRLHKDDILAALRSYVDEVFLPRRVHYVERIPRNLLGKVLGEEFLTVVKDLDGGLIPPNSL